MEKSMFERMGITYRKVGDYYLPNVALPNSTKANYGRWGRHHKEFLLNHHKVVYYNLLTACELNQYLNDLDERAQAMYEKLVDDFAKQEGVDENLKMRDQMLWVKRMNNITNRATEIVNAEMIYTV